MDRYRIVLPHHMLNKLMAAWVGESLRVNPKLIGINKTKDSDVFLKTVIECLSHRSAKMIMEFFGA